MATCLFANHLVKNGCNVPRNKNSSNNAGNTAITTRLINKMGRVEFTVNVRNANLLMYIVDLGESKLPAIVKNAAMSKYPNYRFDDIKKVVRGTETFYRVEMEKRHAADIKATYKPDGTFIKEVYE